MGLKRGTGGGVLRHPDFAGPLMQADPGTCCCPPELGTCICCQEMASIAVTIGGITNGTNCTTCSEWNAGRNIPNSLVDPCGGNAIFFFDLPEDTTVCDSGEDSFTLTCGTISIFWLVYQSSGSSFLGVRIEDTANGNAEFHEEIDYQNCESSFSGSVTRTSSNNGTDCNFSAATCSVIITN